MVRHPGEFAIRDSGGTTAGQSLVAALREPWIRHSGIQNRSQHSTRMLSAAQPCSGADRLIIGGRGKASGNSTDERQLGSVLRHAIAITRRLAQRRSVCPRTPAARKGAGCVRGRDAGRKCHESGCSLQQLADDFAVCAKWAVENGAHGVEANFSCPNVSTADGQLYQQPEAAGLVAERIRDSIGDAPLVLKIGRVATAADATELQQHVAPFVNGLAMTNSIAAQVIADDGELLFDGQSRGICGDATRAASIAQTAMCRQALAAAGHNLDLIGVGGISTADHVREYLSAGATSVALATAAMVDPDIGLQIRSSL